MSRLQDLVAAASSEAVDRMPDFVLEAMAKFENGVHASDDEEDRS